MSQIGTILSDKEGGVGIVIVSNPTKRNAVSLDMWKAVAHVLGSFAYDDDIRAVILTGAGNDTFVSGADVSKFDSERASHQAIREYNSTIEAAAIAIYEFPKPTIAMIRGYCLGGGVGLATCCDLRVCADDSRFAIPAAKLGLGYGYAGLKRLVDLVGPSFAKEIFFTARQFDAHEALAMGLVNRVVPAAELERSVKGLTDIICANAPLTIKAAKYAVGEVIKDESKRNVQRVGELVEQCFASRDYVEGRRAFLEKRRPAFTGT